MMDDMPSGPAQHLHICRSAQVRFMHTFASEGNFIMPGEVNIGWICHFRVKGPCMGMHQLAYFLLFAKNIVMKKLIAAYLSPNG